MIEPITARHLEAAFDRIDHLQSTEDRTILVVAPDSDAIAQITDAVGGKTIRIMAAAASNSGPWSARRRSTTTGLCN